jgi:crotonobetainyl-CoA:carnitine CoA-transferase CaiB-like acyl-CoA transferase
VPELTRFLAGPCTTKWWVSMGEAIGAIPRQRSAADSMWEMPAGGIPCGPVSTVDQAVRDLRAPAREMLVEIRDPKAGPVALAGFPIRLSATPERAQGPAPGLGERADSVPADRLHTSADSAVRLREEGVI